MLQVEINHADGTQRLLQVPDECIIGKSGQNEIQLNSWRVSKEHARLFKAPAGLLLEDMGSYGGVYVNGQRIDTQYGPLKATDVIGIGPFKEILNTRAFAKIPKILETPKGDGGREDVTNLKVLRGLIRKTA